MTVIKLFIAVCFNNIGGSSLKMAITPSKLTLKCTIYRTVRLLILIKFVIQ